MSCSIVTQADFILEIIDGGSPVSRLVLQLWGDFSYTPGGHELTEIMDSKGKFSTLGPIKGAQQPTEFSFTAKQVGTPGTNTGIATTTLVITHAASAEYVVQLEVTKTNLGETEATLYDLEFAAGAAAAATDNAAEAAILALFGITATNAVAGTVVFAAPAGWVVKVVSVDLGTGTVTAAVAYTGGSIASELTLADILHQSGMWPRLVGTNGAAAGCAGVEKTLTMLAHVPGSQKTYTFPLSTFGAGVAVALQGVDLSVTGTSRVPYPEMTAYAA